MMSYQFLGVVSPLQPSNKVEEYSIPSVKHETVAVDIDNVKYPQLLLNDAVPVPFQDNGIYINPIEIPSSIPYKNLVDPIPQPAAMLQKFPPAAAASPQYSWGGMDLLNKTKEVVPANKEKTEEDVLMESLLDIDSLLDHGFGLEETNHDLIPPAQNFILEHTPVPPESASYPSFVSPQLTPTPEPLTNLFSESVGEDLLIPVSTPAVDDGATAPLTEPVKKSNNDLDQLVAELMGGDEWTLSNSLAPYHPPEVNTIPATVSISSATSSDEDDGESYLRSLLGDFGGPFFEETPPPAKRPRGSESSMMTFEDDPPSSGDITPPFHNTPMSSPGTATQSPPAQESPTKLAEKHHSRSPMLFGQHEDSILNKLLVPKLDRSAKPVTRDKLVSMPVEEFNALLDQGGLTEIEVAFMKEWRRRGKNKTAAQIARKRKRDELSELQIEIDDLKHQRDQLQQRTESMSALVASLKRKAQAAENQIYHKSTAAHGLVVSPDTHFIHVTDDGKTVLVPRVSSQVVIH